MIIITDMEEDSTNLLITKYYLNHSIFKSIYEIIDIASYNSGFKTSLVADKDKIVEGEYKEVIDI